MKKDDYRQRYERAFDLTIRYAMLRDMGLFDKLDKGAAIDYLRLVQSLDTYSNEGVVQDFRQWLKMESEEIATKGFDTFLNTTNKLIDVGSTFLKNLKTRFKTRKINPESLDKVMTKIGNAIEIRKKSGKTAVKFCDLSLLEKRISGYAQVVDAIKNIAEDGDKEAFDSDKTYDNLAQQANKALECVKPKDGSFFRELKRTMPYEHTFDAGDSDWADPEQRKSYIRTVLQTKNELFNKTKDAMAFLSKLLNDLKGEVSHTRRDNGEEMVVQYARGYVAQKFLYQLQDCFAEEANLVLKEALSRFTSGIKAPKEERMPEEKQQPEGQEPEQGAQQRQNPESSNDQGDEEEQE